MDTEAHLAGLDIAVLIPCLNEGATIGTVVSSFKRVLPGSVVFVYDNGSTDATVQMAKTAGAVVRKEPLTGKGNVVRRMFSDIEADVYVLVDGDDTYDAKAALGMVDLLVGQSLDLVSGARRQVARAAYRPGHSFGNRLLTTLVGLFFAPRISDLLSGYRVMSRRFVKSFPALAAGFEIEAELSVHALQLRAPIAEVETVYKERVQGSVSKLNTLSDGLRIIRTIFYLIKEERPLAFFGVSAAVLVLCSFGLGTPIVLEFLETGLVPRFPTAILASALMILSFLGFTCGLILDSVALGRAEMKRIAYLGIPLLVERGRRRGSIPRHLGLVRHVRGRVTDKALG